MEKITTAVNTFRAKYNALPGDMDTATAAQLGFAARAGTRGLGDGNSIIEGYSAGFGGGPGYYGQGESIMFWSDLTYANGMNINLIEGNYSAASFTSMAPLPIPTTQIGLYFPAAKIGNGSFIYVDSDYISGKGNYYDLQSNLGIGSSVPAGRLTGGGYSLSVNQAYYIDRKIDDCMPQFGRVLAQFGPSGCWSNPVNIPGYVQNCVSQVPYTIAISGDATTCFDNGNTAGANQGYSVSQNNGNGVNCVLTFEFQ